METQTAKLPPAFVRQMKREELTTAIGWAQAEGWNPGLHDADLFWQTDPQGFLALELNGEMIGCGSVVSYGGKFGFLGLFIVRPEYRGRGLGTVLWNQLCERLRQRLDFGAAIGLDGVFAMQPYYAKSGFAFTHRNLRMQGTGKVLSYHSEHVRAADAASVDLLAPIDHRCFGFDRHEFLRAWINQPQGSSFEYVSDNGCLGFGTIRKCVDGWKIGPLFAKSSDVAEQLFCALVSVADGDAVSIDVPENNAGALELAKKYNMSECFGCARMYAGPAPQLPWDEIFGITTFELG